MVNNMKIGKYVLSASLAMILFAGLASCKGRTLKDVEPTGDTVEVVINTPDSVSDSVSINAESNPQ